MPESPRVDPLAVLLSQPPGSCVYTRMQIDAGAWEVAWLLREDSARIRALGPGPDVECRAGALPQRFHGQEILLIPILVRVGPGVQENLWETWLNVYQDEGGIVYLHDLARQDRLTLHVYGDRGTRERSLVVSNQLRTFAEQALVEAERYPPWSMHAYDRARAQCYRRYPTVLALWEALGRRP